MPLKSWSILTAIFVLLLAGFLCVTPHAEAITTTNNGFSVEWDVVALTDIYTQHPEGQPSYYGDYKVFSYTTAKPFGFLGTDLHITITLPARDVPSAWSGRAITVSDAWGGQWTVEQHVSPTIDPNTQQNIYSFPELVFDKVIRVYPPFAGYTALTFWVSPGDVLSSIQVNFYADQSASIGGDPPGKGPPEDPNDKEYDPPPACATGGFPTYSVNTVYLNLVVQDTEFAVQSLGHRLATTRTWNTDPSWTGMFGNGWSFLYESILEKSCVGARVVSGSGKGTAYFAATSLCSAGGTLTYPVSTVPLSPGVYDKLTYRNGDYWLLEKKDSRQTYRYDLASGDRYRLTSITDQNGNALTILYNTDGTIGSVKDAAGRQLSFTYDSNKRAIAMGTPDGRQASYDYDARGNLIRTVDLFGTEILYTYDADNYMSAMSYAGKTVSYTYDTSGGRKYIATVVDANGNTRKYAASSVGSTSVTDARGGVTSYASVNGQTVSVADPLGHASSRTFGGSGLPVSVTDPKNNKVIMAYDSRGNRTKMTDALGKITTYAYDANDNRITQTNPLGEKWTYAYDGRNNLTSVTSPANNVNTLTYDTKGQLTSVTDANGHTTTFTYDSFGNRLTVTDALGKTTSFVYDSAGINRTSAVDPNGNASFFAYDQNRRLTRITHADGTHRDFSYDACAMTGMTDENGHSLSFTRDNMLRVTGITDAMNAVSANTYDGNGNLVTTTDPLQQIVSMTYDAANRLATLTDPSGGSMLFTHDANGNVTAIQDERLKQTTFWFDANDKILSTTDPLGRSVTVLWDDLGRLKQMNNARGGMIRTAYNSEGRLSAETYFNATTRIFDTVATYSYDNAGNLSSFMDNGGTTTFTYNARNEVTGISYPDGKAVGFAYDDAGNMAATNYPGGLALTYGISNRHRIQTMQWDTSSVAFSYDAVGNLLSETRSNGTSADYLYDANNRITSLRHKKGTSTIASMVYTRNAGGSIISESATLPAVIGLTNSTASGVYDNANQLSSFGGSASSYDADGNLTGVSGDRAFTGAYDPENRLLQMTSGGVMASYTYSALGARASEVRGTETTKYYHDHRGRLLFDADGSGNIMNYYLYKGGRLVAMRSAAGGSYFYHYDKNGNTIAITNENGNTANAYAYTPYGEIAGSTETVANRFKYVGAYGVMDEGSGIYFMKNRYYDTGTGRFMQRDPLGFAGGQTNLYAYVGSNPVTRVDPSGLLGSSDYSDDKFLNSPPTPTPMPKSMFESAMDLLDKYASIAEAMIQKQLNDGKIMESQKLMNDEMKIRELQTNCIKSMDGMQRAAVRNLR